MSLPFGPLDGEMSNGVFYHSRNLDNVELELRDIIADVDTLNDEVTLYLIKNLRVPPPTTTLPPTDKEVLFPAYLINLATSMMWTNGFVKESERFLANVMQSIQQEVMQHGSHGVLDPGAFWLSNVHEMLSFAEDLYEQQRTNNSKYDRLLEIVTHDLECLEYNIYHIWMKMLKRELQKMIIPAIVESQSLPGFIVNEDKRFFKLWHSNNTPAFSMDNLLSLLNNIHGVMKAYYLEDSIITQTVTELLRLVGVTAFNDLLMRRNFLSWRRSLQINYNVTKIEEWCRSHSMPEATLQLEHLTQATKLLQMRKTTLNDLEVSLDICWMLSPNQIHKLLKQYLVADYEQPIDGVIFKALASRFTEESDVLLLTPVDIEASGPYEVAEPRVITSLETYTPPWLQAPRLRRLVQIARAQDIMRTRNCVVCTEAIPTPELPTLTNCKHKPQVCADCYKNWIASELDNTSRKEIRCPESGCGELLNHAEVRQYASPGIYAKFDDFSVRDALNNDPNFRWCRRVGCGSGQIHENDAGGNIFRCIVCGFKACFVHEDTWHEGETCEEYDYKESGRRGRDQKMQEEASVKVILQLAKKCPGKGGMCGWNIEKNSGCDHMTCTSPPSPDYRISMK
ncbi:MAG: Myosin type-2 heavy chain 1 [Geoglossum simile]|nr:MAG: Myosin type-2 heavy chain 1 [Geoglossum simile]